MPSIGQVFHEVVQRRKPAIRGVSQHRVEPVFGFASKHGDAHVATSIEIDRTAIQHRQASRYMEAAQGDLYPSLAERSCDIESARILVRLDTGQRDEAEITVRSEAGEERRHVDARVGLVDHLDVDGDVRSEYLPLGAICCDSVDGGKRVRGIIARHQRITYPSSS